LDVTQPFLISQQKLRDRSPQERSFQKKSNYDFHVLRLLNLSKKKSRLIMRAFQEKLITFSVKNNNFPLMNPLLAAIDLQEALPRVIHDPDKKIHCRIQTERTAFLLYRV